MSALLPLDSIRTDGGTQPRAGMDYDAVNDYAEAMNTGTAFPALVVFYDGTDYWLADGFHRYRAAELAGLEQIASDVHQGTQQDAQWYSFGANKSNGLRRTNEDKQRAVKAALAHPNAAGMSDRQIAEHVGVAPITVGEWRKKFLPLSESDSQHRTGRDGRTINVANIGKQSSRPAVPAAPAPAASAAPTPAPTRRPPEVLHSAPLSNAQNPIAVQQQPATVAPAVPPPALLPAAPALPPPTSTPEHPDWCAGFVRACMEIATCPVPATQAATFIAKTNNDFFNHLEKANEILSAILASRQ